MASTASRRAALSLFLVIAGCGVSADPEDASTSDAFGATDVPVALDGPLTDADVPSLTFEHDWPEADLCAVEGNPEPQCCAEGRIALPDVAASVLDLRGLVSGAAGTCGDPVKRILPADRDAYPLMVLLPAVTEPDPLCVSGCAGRGRATSFGIVLELPAALSLTFRPLVVAPPPWRYVYDHNSLAGDACLDGYQEFGERACVRPNYGGAIGFATGATDVPVRAALIDLAEGENGAVETCCPYLPR